MKPLVLLAIFALGCEHDPRFERHRDEKRPEPVVAVQQTPEPTPPPIINKTIERPAIMPKPLKRRVHHHHH